MMQPTIFALGVIFAVPCSCTSHSHKRLLRRDIAGSHGVKQRKAALQVNGQTNRSEEEIEYPKMIHQQFRTANTEDWPQNFDRSRPWLNKHPDWEYRFWTDKQEHDLFRHQLRQFLPTYQALGCSPYGAILRADLSVWGILHEFGGVYADLDSLPVRSISDFVDELFRHGIRIVVTEFEPEDGSDAEGPSAVLDKDVLIVLQRRHPWVYQVLQNVQRFVSHHGPKICQVTNNPAEHPNRIEVMRVASALQLPLDVDAYDGVHDMRLLSLDPTHGPADDFQEKLGHWAKGMLSAKSSQASLIPQVPVFRFRGDLALLLCQDGASLENTVADILSTKHGQSWRNLARSRYASLLQVHQGHGKNRCEKWKVANSLKSKEDADVVSFLKDDDAEGGKSDDEADEN